MAKNPYYQKEVTCPVCLTEFETTAVRPNRCIPNGRDSDFCQHYPDANPYFYDSWVCPECHYASPKSIFNDLKKSEVNTIAKILANSELNLSPTGQRDLEQAIIYNKLALLFLSYRDVTNGIIAGITLKTAWLFRLKEDKDQEKEYLEKALGFYKEAYSKERLPIGGLNEVKITYLLGELSRRIGNYKEAIKWFDKTVNNPLASTQPALVKMARDQWALTKDLYDKYRPLSG